MKHNKIIDNLVNKKYKIKYILKNPFIIFKINDFLDNDEYYYFKKNFNKLSDLKIDKSLLNNNKFAYNSSTEFYKNNLKSNQSFSDFHNIIFNKFFIDYFYKNFFSSYLLSKLMDPPSLIKMLRPKIYNFESHRRYSLFEKLFFSKLTPQVEYSYMLNEGNIVPHTDYKNKLISLMLYFPDDELSGKYHNNIGTTFYKSNKIDLSNRHLDNIEDQINFNSQSEEILTLPFESKTLFGFIRNKYSWHSVKKIDVNDNFVRKSININLYL